MGVIKKSIPVERIKFNIDYCEKIILQTPNDLFCTRSFKNKDRCSIQGLFAILDKENSDIIPSKEQLRDLRITFSDFKGMVCGVWHKSIDTTSRFSCVYHLFGGHSSCGRHHVARINNERVSPYDQETPKERLLAAISDIKKGVYEYQEHIPKVLLSE